MLMGFCLVIGWGGFRLPLKMSDHLSQEEKARQALFPPKPME